jgi:hypothetical protein
MTGHLLDAFEKGCAKNFNESFNDGDHALDKLETSPQSFRNEPMLPKNRSFGSSYLIVLAACSICIAPSLRETRGPS